MINVTQETQDEAELQTMAIDDDPADEDDDEMAFDRGEDPAIDGDLYRDDDPADEDDEDETCPHGRQNWGEDCIACEDAEILDRAQQLGLADPQEE